MRMMIVIQVLTAISCSLKWTDNAGQNVLDRKVSFSLKEVTFKRALKEIEKEGNVKFVYSRNHIDMSGDVTLEVSERSLKEVFEDLFVPRRIKYMLEEDDYIILTTRKDKKPAEEDISSQSEIQPLITVTGSVISGVDQEPLPGANVIIKGTLKGTSTDKDGKYSISAGAGDVLVFSFVGFESSETPIGGRTLIDIKLRSMVLEEVVVNAGYWKIRERERTGNISKITLEDIQKQPVSNPLAALVGRMPGVYIQQETGVPGGAFTIQIRGQNSLRHEGNYPLYVIDGVPFTAAPLSSSLIGGEIIPGANPLNSINPADIESVEVLKDADATSVYGSRGANGVMLITTKRGKPGKTKIDVNVYSGVGQVTRTMDLLNPPVY
jgi:TonB-dependent starch-binding outer membrane protein SusC